MKKKNLAEITFWLSVTVMRSDNRQRTRSGKVIRLVINNFKMNARGDLMSYTACIFSTILLLALMATTTQESRTHRYHKFVSAKKHFVQNSQCFLKEARRRILSNSKLNGFLIPSKSCNWFSLSYARKIWIISDELSLFDLKKKTHNVKVSLIAFPCTLHQSKSAFQSIFYLARL